MRLARHYNKVSILVTISVLFIAAIIYYFAINYISRNQLDQSLNEEMDELQSFVKLHQQLPSLPTLEEYETIVRRSDSSISNRSYFDTIYYDPKEKKVEKGRAVLGGFTLHGNHYKVTITISRESTVYLLQVVTLITLFLIMGLLIILFIINRYVLNRLWQPFYDLLLQLKCYTVSDKKGFVLMTNNVDEFAELNNALNVMSSRVKNDFENLKQYTENASHEIMTPLSVITSKLDTLIQDEFLTTKQYQQLNDIYIASGKLSKLNQSLLLLVKIENNLVGGEESMGLDVAIFEKLRQFQELIAAKRLTVHEDLDLKWVICSKYLLDIMLNNLFSNAIRHNVDEGSIRIKLTNESLLFQNSGQQVPLDDVKIFERFHKGENSEGSGLGLTVVKNICTLYNWKLSYSFQDSLHNFKIIF